MLKVVVREGAQSRVSCPHEGTQSHIVRHQGKVHVPALLVVRQGTQAHSARLLGGHCSQIPRAQLRILAGFAKDLRTSHAQAQCSTP